MRERTNDNEKRKYASIGSTIGMELAQTDRAIYKNPKI